MAVQLQGLHEPEPHLYIPFRLKYEGIWDAYYEKRIRRSLKIRASLDAPAISDCFQSLFIKEIISIDPNASFIWLVRNKSDCVRSMLQRKALPFWETEELASEYYDRINDRIRKDLVGLKYEKVNVDDLEIHLNGANDPLEGSDFRDVACGASA